MTVPSYLQSQDSGAQLTLSSRSAFNSFMFIKCLPYYESGSF